MDRPRERRRDDALGGAHVQPARLGQQAAAGEQSLDQETGVVALARGGGGGQQLGEGQAQALVVEGGLRHRLTPGSRRSPISPSLCWTTSRG
jgi:hypothetical protein